MALQSSPPPPPPPPPLNGAGICIDIIITLSL